MMAWRIVKVSTINPILQAACQRSLAAQVQALVDSAQKDAQKTLLMTAHVAALRESWRIRKMRKTAAQWQTLGWKKKPVSGIYCPVWYGMVYYYIYCLGRWIEKKPLLWTHCPALFLPLNRQGG